MRLGVGSGLALLGTLSGTPAVAAERVPIGAIPLVQPVSIPVLPPFRLRVVVPPSDAAWRMQGPQALTRRGIGGALIDFFPFDDRFHLSAGGRLFNRAGARSSDPASLALLPAFKMPGARSGRKFTPTMLMGYSRTGGNGLALGIDAGVLMGKADPGPDYRVSGDRGRAMGGVNGLARMTLKAPF